MAGPLPVASWVHRGRTSPWPQCDGTTGGDRGRYRRTHQRRGDRGAAGPHQGPDGRQVADDDRPQADRSPLPDHVVRVLPRRRRDGADHPRRAGPARAAVRERRGLQPAVHDARHDHAAAVRHPAVRRLRERDHAAADRRPGRRVPAAEHVQLLAVPVRRPDHDGGFLIPGGAADFGWTGYAPLSTEVRSPGVGARPVGDGPVDGRSGHHPRCASTSSPRSSPCARRG